MSNSVFTNTWSINKGELSWGGGGWNVILYQILDPLKNQISDITTPKNHISDI